MNWYEITFDLMTSEPGSKPTYLREQNAIMRYIQCLARNFTKTRHDIFIDESDLIAIGIAKIRDRIDTFDVRSENDDTVTAQFKLWISITCRRKWTDEYNKIKRKQDYETKNYLSGENYDAKNNLETVDPVDIDPLVVNAEDRSLMRDILRGVLADFPEHRSEAILSFRSTRKGRNGKRGFEGETAEIAAKAGVEQCTIRKWSERFEDTCLDRYEQEKRNDKNNQVTSKKTSR